jgi:hypothetical protein
VQDSRQSLQLLSVEGDQRGAMLLGNGSIHGISATEARGSREVNRTILKRGV